MMVYSSPGEMFSTMATAFAFGIVVGSGATFALWRWAHKGRLAREKRGEPQVRATANFRNGVKFTQGGR